MKEYGASYMVINSVTTVSAYAKLLDLKTGQTLWEGSASASSNENQNHSGGGLIGILASAVINQIISDVTNASHSIADLASRRLLTAHPNGMLYGPRSPKYQTD